MYAPYFGLSKEPFSIAPDPRFLYMSEQHREALAHLLYGLGAGGGFVLLTGEVGAGKTTVCRCFLEQLPAHCTVAYVFNPKLSAIELLQTVCGEFGLAPPQPADSVKAHVDALNHFLLDAHAQGRQPVLVIDEAQSLSADVLEQLRLLTNLETSERKLLQIVLIGQPELRDMLAQPGLRQLAQRVVARFHLGALSAAQTPQYVRHRLAVAGTSGELPFTEGALARLHKLSQGVPRRINLLADRALLGAYAQGQPRADRRTVEQAAREVLAGDAARPMWRARAWALAAVAGMLGLGLGALWRATPPADHEVAAPGPAAVASAAPQVVAPALPLAPPGDLVPAAALSDPAELLAAAHTQPATAWRELALRWNVAIGEGEPCVVAQQAQLACFRSATGGLAMARQLARPVLLELRGDDGAVVLATLVALDDRRATLEAAGRSFVIGLPTLADLWRGDLATFWRTPPGWREGGDSARAEPLRGWLDEQLASAGFEAGRPLPQRVRAFQIAQGLPPDAVVGPMTLMRLAWVTRPAGMDEPRLLGSP